MVVIVERQSETIVWSHVDGPVVVSCGYCPVGWVIEEVRIHLHTDAVTTVNARIAATIGAVGVADEAAFRAGSTLWRGLGTALIFEKPGLMFRGSSIAMVWDVFRPYVRAVSGPLTVFFARQVTGQDPEWSITVVCGRPLDVEKLIGGAFPGGQSGRAGA